MCKGTPRPSEKKWRYFDSIRNRWGDCHLEGKELIIIKEIVEVLERRQKDKLPAYRDIPKMFLEETA